MNSCICPNGENVIPITQDVREKQFSVSKESIIHKEVTLIHEEPEYAKLRIKMQEIQNESNLLKSQVLALNSMLEEVRLLFDKALPIDNTNNSNVNINGD